MFQLNTLRRGCLHIVHIYVSAYASPVGAWCRAIFVKHVCINPFTGEFMVTVSDINGLFFPIKFIVKQVFE